MIHVDKWRSRWMWTFLLVSSVAFLQGPALVSAQSAPQPTPPAPSPNAPFEATLLVGGGMYTRFGVVQKPGADLLPPTDKGRFEVSKTASDAYVFKVPTLRNMALTTPYFHIQSSVGSPPGRGHYGVKPAWEPPRGRAPRSRPSSRPTPASNLRSCCRS